MRGIDGHSGSGHSGPNDDDVKSLGTETLNGCGAIEEIHPSMLAQAAIGYFEPSLR